MHDQHRPQAFKIGQTVNYHGQNYHVIGNDVARRMVLIDQGRIGKYVHIESLKAVQS